MTRRRILLALLLLLPFVYGYHFVSTKGVRQTVAMNDGGVRLMVQVLEPTPEYALRARVTVRNISLRPISYQASAMCHEAGSLALLSPEGDPEPVPLAWQRGNPVRPCTVDRKRFTILPGFSQTHEYAMTSLPAGARLEGRFMADGWKSPIAVRLTLP